MISQFGLGLLSGIFITLIAYLINEIGIAYLINEIGDAIEPEEQKQPTWNEHGA